ncbi:ferrochelatase [Polycladidibacter hongkongensis]|uniref:ferrochelatase n=1 Tax=Polycladidibacter hongkongensis TaxID=1647556 RepID=UPI000829C9BE|nr:ferrochelatase [Pseudovibrio hongkongensis]
MADAQKQAVNASDEYTVLPTEHPQVAFGRVGVLLVNLGTPDGTDFRSMRRYLEEFLTDKRVIEWPKALWYPILYGIVLNKRPQKSGAAYREIWNTELDESPLRTITRSQCEKMAARLANLGDRLEVDWAMRYGQPAIQEAIARLQAKGCERILVFPLYPQYAASTTATVNDEVCRYMLKQRWQPALRTAPAYHDDPAYISALAKSIETHLAGLDFEPEVMLASFHGIPQSYFKKGDPYHCHCQKTARLLAKELGWEEGRLRITFQSRFGPEEWLQPYTDKTVEELAKQGVKKLAILNPGFVADCLETLEEIAGEAGEIFLEHGGEKFSHIPCLNDSEIGMDVLEAVVRRELKGWLE